MFVFDGPVENKNGTLWIGTAYGELTNGSDVSKCCLSLHGHIRAYLFQHAALWANTARMSKNRARVLVKGICLRTVVVASCVLLRNTCGQHAPAVKTSIAILTEIHLRERTQGW